MSHRHDREYYLLAGLLEVPAASIGGALQAAGAAVDVAPDRSRCRALIRRRRYDVVLLMLGARPTADLADVACCRQYGAGAGIVTVLPDRDAAQVARLLDAGADDCMSAPCDPREVLARLRALVRRLGKPPENTSVVLRTHDLEIDTASRVVRRAGKVIALTPREYALLHLLALHRGRVVDRTQINRQLYGAVDSGGSNVVDVFVGYLRAKIDKGFDPPLILTRWRQGYLLVADDERREPAATA